MSVGAYNVGDVCRIKSWSDMIKIGYEPVDGRIEFPDLTVAFTSDMEYLCGEVFTIKLVKEFSYDHDHSEMVYRYYSCEGVEDKGDVFGGKWIITTPMLEPIVQNDDGLEFDFDLSGLL